MAFIINLMGDFHEIVRVENNYKWDHKWKINKNFNLYEILNLVNCELQLCFV